MYSVCTCNTEAHSRNHCCRVTAIRITYSECIFVALFIQNANLMRRHYNIFVHYLINGKKTKLLNIKCAFCLFYNFCLKYFSFLEEFSETLS
jgi:hypothetical protein